MSKFREAELLRNPIFWLIAVAFVAAAVIIFFGAYISDAFSLLTLRLLVGFSIFFGTVMSVLIYTLYLKEETQKKLKEKKELRAKDKEHEEVVDEKVNELKTRFVEAMKIIKNSSIYKNKHDAKYELPWYLMVGRETEGKTSLLESSGLEFPLNINYENRTVIDGGATKSFQWYFAEHAIFVDMPGQYIKQTEGSENANVWHAFLRLFKRQRWNRPINGVILTISVDTLMEKSEKELEKYAKDLRDRFDELSRTFASNIPIYMLVTKTDKISGFSEYFATLSDDERDEVLGMTFKDEENIDSSLLQPEFDALIGRLNSSVLDRVHHEWDNAARSKVLLFCDEFTSVFEKLKLFIDIGFAQTRYRSPLMLRGIYFTSVPNVTAPAYENDVTAAHEGALPSALSGKGFFIQKVLKDIIFPEADIVKMDNNYRQKHKKRQIAAFAASALIVAFVTAFWIQDFNHHTNTLDRLEDALVQYERDRGQISAADDFEKSLALLNDIYTVKTADDFNSSTRLWKLAYFKVPQRQEMLDNLYDEALQKLLLPRIGEFIEKQVIANLGNYNLTWESTKAYSMLHNEQKRNNTFLEQWMATGWSHLYPNKLTIQEDLNSHWKRLLSSGFTPYELNEQTLTTARNKLLGYGHEALVYKQLKEKAEEGDLRSFQFSQVMGSNTAVFSGADKVIPGFFTKEGYEQIVVVQGKELVKELVHTNWVVGYSSSLSDADLNEMYAKVQSFYFTDYKKHWLSALNALKIPKRGSIAQISNQLTVLTSGDSPILAVLNALKRNTELYTPAEKLQMKAAASSATTSKAATLASEKAIEKAKKIIDNVSVKNVRDFFSQYNKLLDKEAQPGSKLKLAMNKLEKVYQETTAIYGSVTPQKDAFNIVIDRINGRHAPIVMKMSSLPLAVDKWFRKALNNDWQYIVAQSKYYIDTQYKAQIFAYYQEKILTKYPFNMNATQDVTLHDFEEYFKKGGVVDHFYEQYVSPFVKLDSKLNSYQFRKVDGIKMHFSEEFMNSLFVMQEIRQCFFKANGDKLGTTIYIKPYTLGRNLATMLLYYDDKRIGYEHGPIKTRKMQWPAETEYTDAKYKLYDLHKEQVISLVDEGEWAIYKLLNRMKMKDYRANRAEGSIVAEYNNNRFKGAFSLSGPAIKIFSKNNPIKKYKLDRNI